ncbi:MAG: flagellar motor protein MotB [Clostridium sp.]|nr:flagellar motor protein MotB [Clostridium sp.]
MAKRKPEEPPKGSPAWMSTFSDLMNLLLCFFVMLFAMSTIDAQKFEQVAASFNQTFSVFSAGATAIGDGFLIGMGVSQLNELDDYINSTGKNPEGEELPEDLQEAAEMLDEAKLQESEEMAEKIEEVLEEKNLEKEIDIEFTAQYVQLTLNGALLFDSGSVEIKEEAMPLMNQLGIILQRFSQGTIEIEGHTDNVPMSGSKYSNNDELSSGRALSVFYYLEQNTTLDVGQIKHSGRGEYQPIADNSTPEGRAQNRRVEIKIYNALSSY